MLGPYLVLLSSTVHGYEGTGRSLSLKLFEQLRMQSTKVGGVNLTELKLEEPIRYKIGDPVEQWLNKLLCLDASQRIISGCPTPKECSLYFVDKDILFSYHKASEAFLHRIMTLYVSSHYKNSPNDLQLLSDAPAHQLLVMLGPIDNNSSQLPEVLCVIQICYEGQINREIVKTELEKRTSICWGSYSLDYLSAISRYKLWRVIWCKNCQDSYPSRFSGYGIWKACHGSFNTVLSR